MKIIRFDLKNLKYIKEKINKHFYNETLSPGLSDELNNKNFLNLINSYDIQQVNFIIHKIFCL